jgi:hypothetical protein
MAKFNFSQVSSGFEPLPTGTYEVKITEFDDTKKTEKGDVKFNYTAEVVNPTEFRGKKVWINCPQNDNPFMFFNLIMAVEDLPEPTVRAMTEYDERKPVGMFLIVTGEDVINKDSGKHFFNIKKMEPSDLQRKANKAPKLS